MDLGIKNKVALVTGGGGGLGGAIATSLAKEGARVIVADIDLEAAQGITKQLTNQGLDAMPIKWDLFDIEGIEGYLEEVTGHWGDRKSTRLNSSHVAISYAVFCLKKKKNRIDGSLDVGREERDMG